LEQAVSTGRVPKDIANVLKRQGAAAVMIKLNIAWRPEHELDATQVDRQPQQINRTQQAIVDKWGGADV